VTLRQDVLLGPLDAWLATKFEPRHLPVTIDELAAAVSEPPEIPAEPEQITAKITECDRKLAQCWAALDAGADPADKAEIYTQLGLRLVYQPGDRLVRAEAHINPAQHWQFESVRGGT
jgi:hypothetical protein